MRAFWQRKVCRSVLAFALLSAGCGRINYDPNALGDASPNAIDAAGLACGEAGGSLDESFGDMGQRSFDFGAGPDYAWALLAQPDGKLVASGRSELGGNNAFAVARLSADGVLDPSFGTGGLVEVQYNHDFGYSSALQSDGKLVVAGDTWNFGRADDFLLTRLNTDGTLDTTFGASGNVLLHFASGDSGRSVGVRDSGEIVIAGTAAYTSANPDFGLVQMDETGAPDPSFGTNGQVRTDFGVGVDSVAQAARGMHIFPSGKLLVAGSAETGSLQDFALAQYTATGVLDQSFNNDGRVVTDLGGNDIAASLVVTADGKLVVGGYSTQAAEDSIALSRYEADGSLDLTFGTDGVVLTALPGGQARIHAVVESAGSLIVAGETGPMGAKDIFVARYCSDGSLDTMFGVEGFVVQDLNGGDDVATDLVLQGDRVVVLAQTSIAGIARFVLLRFQL